jgi:ketosteroid isomerase-like protein
MPTNKATVEQYFDAFNQANRERILSLLTDDVVWDIPRTHLGSGKATGKEAFGDEALKAPPGTVATITRLVEENDVVVAEGTVTTQAPDGSPFTLVFCDLFILRENKIAHLTSYLAQPE